VLTAETQLLSVIYSTGDEGPGEDVQTDPDNRMDKVRDTYRTSDQDQPGRKRGRGMHVQTVQTSRRGYLQVIQNNPAILKRYSSSETESGQEKEQRTDIGLFY